MAEPPTPDSATEGITITRVFDAPRERVWKEWWGSFFDRMAENLADD